MGAVLTPRPALAVIIVTKNRADAIERYALPGLGRSRFRDFVCVVWDASDGGSTREVVERGFWGFEVFYRGAPRVGSSSQRNDAARFVLEAFPSVRRVVFIDDDSELSPGALGGVTDAFREKGVLIVNIPMRPLAPSSFRAKAVQALKRLLGMNRHGATSFLYNYGGDDEPGCDVDWASGGGMGVDVSVFRDLRLFFPEEFQRFGGYALGEDFAFSFFVTRKGYGRAVNSREGYFLHHAAGPARLNVENLAAAKWYNFHRLFAALYGDERPGLWLRACFKLFMCAAAVKLLFRARSFGVRAALRGIRAARAALRRDPEGKGGRELFS